MMRINLLPYREAARRRRKAAFLAQMALGAIVGAAAVLLVGGLNARAIAIQDQRNAVLAAAVGGLDRKIAEVAALRREIAALGARRQAIEALQGDRNEPVRLLDELAVRTPPGVYLKSVKEDGRKVALLGYAQSQERVSELLRRLAGASPSLERPELIEAKSAVLGQGGAGAKVVEFHLVAQLKAPIAPTGPAPDPP
nr:PilN domain-containing protein [uncultured Duganella sp.]